MSRSPRLALAAATVFLLAGCAELEKIAASAFEKPRLTFRSADLQALDLEGATVGFSYDLENPNGFGLSLARLGYGVEVEGTRVATGELPGGLTIAANGRTPVTFPVRVRWTDVPGIVGLLGKREAVAYKLSGNVGVKTPLGVVELPLSHQDRLALPRLPGFSVEGLAIRQVSFTDVTLEVKVKVANPNAFPLPAGKIDYALSLAGNPVARADGKSLAMVAGGKDAVIAIPVKVNLAQAGRAASALMGGGNVELGLTGTADVAGLSLPLNWTGKLPVRR
jgi:LEA14-like dessication related protein